MITDYSSTIFDYAHLNKPIFLLQEDNSQYKHAYTVNYLLVIRKWVYLNVHNQKLSMNNQ